MLSLAKNAETLLLLITFKICEKKKNTSITMQQTSKWQTQQVLAYFLQDSKETKYVFFSKICL